MPYAKLNIHVHAELKADSSGVDFRVDQDGGDDHQRMKGGILQVEYREKFEMRFHLKDNSGLGLQFVQGPDTNTTKPSDTTGPFWVHEGTACPPSRGDTRNFIVEKVSNNLLVVENQNRELANYYYRLAFKARDGAPHAYDPIIQNGGGGGGSQSMNWLAVLLGLLGLCAVGAIVAYAAGWLS